MAKNYIETIPQHYIAIEGVIGVGKTALATKLARYIDARLILEEVEENPFLANFYQDMRSYALATQLFFLLSRKRQQEQIAQIDLFTQRVVSDYLFEKDRIFAYLTLSDAEIKLYEKIYQFLAKDLPRPDLVIYLQAPVDILLVRIKKRGRNFEQEIDRKYLELLTDAYNHFFLHYSEAPLLIVDCATIDFVKNNLEFFDLFHAIASTTSGKKYYSPKPKEKK
ncbi:MAG: deoxynucleoside kinase [candidate division WOR-3 bacterium]|nr:deoxynucleoside kinase [candidate division WOR-3 bacterium]MCX7757682.1 deoxynucleoside kinase [candidate division WOR-3 bacterium]MDW7987955.1 deoxynucleoside kinase [candidate division WOR-3 bacterium]